MFLLLLALASVSDAARIFGFFPTPSISHQVAFRPLVHELARRGHEVVVVTTDPVYPKGQTPPNLTEIDVRDISYGKWGEFSSLTTGKSDSTFGQMDAVMGIFGEIFEAQLQNEVIKDIIQNKNDTFDLLLLENCVRPSWVLTHVIKAPAIFLSSFGGMQGVYGATGAPNQIFLYPEPLRQRLFNLTFLEKITELYNTLYLEYRYFLWRANDNARNWRLFGDDVPSVEKLKKNMEMLFLNLHPAWDNNRPVPPNFVYMGGIHQKPEKQLPTVSVD